MAPKKLDMHPVFDKLGTYTHSKDVFRSPDTPSFTKCRTRCKTNGGRKGCSARCRAAMDDDDNGDSGGAQTSAMVALWQYLTTLAVVTDKAQLYDDVVAFTELAYCGKHRGKKTLVDGLARWKADLAELEEEVEGSEYDDEFEGFEDVEGEDEEDEDVDFSRSTSDDTAITVFSETSAVDMPSFCTVSDAESDTESKSRVDDDIYQESAPLEPDTTAAADVRIHDEDVSAPVVSTTFVTAATFDADDDVSSEEDFMDASEVATSLTADAEFLAADADHEVAKVAEVASKPMASAPVVADSAHCVSDAADSIVVKEATQASTAVSAPLVADAEVRVADADHAVAAVADAVSAPIAPTPVTVAPELSASVAAESAVVEKDTPATSEETTPLIMLEHQDVSKLVNIEQGDSLAFVKPVAVESTPSQDIQHCDSGMQLPRDINDAEPLDKSFGAVTHLGHKDNSRSHHEMSAESGGTTHMMNRSSVCGIAAITPPPVEASGETHGLFESVTGKDCIASSDKVDVCAKPSIVLSQSTRSAQEDVGVTTDNMPTPPETSTSGRVSGDIAPPLYNDTVSLCNDGDVAVENTLQPSVSNAGHIAASDNLPLIPAPSTIAEDTESNDREQLPWVPFQLPGSW